MGVSWFFDQLIYICFLTSQSSGLPSSAFQVPYDSFKEQLNSPIVEHSLNTSSSENGLPESKPKDLDYDFCCFFLSSHRLDLYRSIDMRCEDMLSG